MATHSLRRAFTLVELLVVIAIIGILVGMMMPAVQMAREAGRRSACTNNVHQLGLAMANYESASRKFPMNWGTGSDTSAPATSDRGHSWITYLLPYMEEKPLYDSIQLGSPTGVTTLGKIMDPNNQLAAMRTLPNLKCPSDTHDGTMSNQAFAQGAVPVTNYKVCAGANWEHGTYKYCKNDAQPKKYYGRNATKYDGRDYGDGVICRGWMQAGGSGYRPFTTTASDVRDGMSKTFACGEVVPEFNQWCSWYWWNNATATCAMPPNYENVNKTRREYPSDWQDYSGFQSRHPGLVVMGLLDGSTKTISSDIEIEIWRAYATIDGGEVASLPD